MDLLIEFAKIGLGIGCVIKELVQKELESGVLVEIPLDIPSTEEPSASPITRPTRPWP